MSKLEDLVPPLELCKRIPADDKLFQQTALAWVLLGKDWPTVLERERLPKDRTGFEVIPAPTLPEILYDLELSGFYCPTCYHHNDQWHVTCESDPADEDYSKCPTLYEATDAVDPASAALKLWMQVNDVEVKDE